MSSSPLTLREWLSREPFALAMSSGFFSFFAHTGFLGALEEAGLLPTRLSGSSAGALVAGAWAAGRSTSELADELMRLQRDDFWDPGVGLGVLRGRLFEERLRRMLPVHSFEACRVPVMVSVFDVLARRTEVCAAGDLPSAIVASCTVPIMFHPKRREGRLLVDGGVADRPGLAGLADGTRTLFHHIASKSPWRTAASMKMPRRRNMHTFVIEALPRSGPFRLQAGKEALELARAATRRALDLPIVTDFSDRGAFATHSVVRVEGGVS